MTSTLLTQFVVNFDREITFFDKNPTDELDFILKIFIFDRILLSKHSANWGIWDASKLNINYGRAILNLRLKPRD